MSSLTYTHTTRLEVTECGVCGIPHAIPKNLYQRALESGASWYCPNGHSLVFTETENEKLKRQLNWANTARQAAWDQAESAQRSAAAYKGHLTRTRKRVAAGVCPCCNRTFQNLGRHMAGQHPGFADEVVT